MSIGVYKIENKVTGKYYVGSSVNLPKRLREHRRTLNLGSHRNIHLQRSWDKYKESSFEFSVLEESEEGVLLKREQYWMDHLNTHNVDFGYNICAIAGRTTGYIHTPETREKISRLAKERSKRPDFHLRSYYFAKGHVTSEENRKIIGAASSKRHCGSLSHWSKLTDKDVMEIVPLIKEGKSDEEISVLYEVSRKTISNIRTKSSFKTLLSEIAPGVGDIPRPDWVNRKGSNNPSAKLSDSEVLIIKEKLSAGESISELAREFDVSWNSIKNIKSGKTWSHIKLKGAIE